MKSSQSAVFNCSTAGFLFLFLFVFLSSFVSDCQAFKCYVCNSAFTKDCGISPVPEKYLVECSPQTASPLQPPDNEHSTEREVRFSAPKDTNFTFCRKNVVTVPQQDNGNNSRPMETRITRSCGFIEKEKTSSCKWGQNHGVQNLMCVCNGEACNSASSWRIIQGVISTLTLLSIASWAL